MHSLDGRQDQARDYQSISRAVGTVKSGRIGEKLPVLPAAQAIRLMRMDVAMDFGAPAAWFQMVNNRIVGPRHPKAL